MKNTFSFCVTIILALFVTSFKPNTVNADDTKRLESENKIPEIVVKAKKVEEKETPQTDEWSASQKVSAEDTISGVLDARSFEQNPQMEVLQSGAGSQQGSFFLKGGLAADTSIYADGLKLNETTHPAGGADALFVTLFSPREIKLIRGPETVEKGNGHLFGLLEWKDISFDPEKNVFVSGSMSHSQNVKFNLVAQHLQKEYKMAVGIAHQKDSDQSAAASENTSFEKDRSEAWSGVASLEKNWEEEWGLNVLLMQADLKSDFDQFEGEDGDDPNSTFSLRSEGALFKVTKGNAQRKTEIRIGFSQTLRNVQDAPDDKHPYDVSFTQNGRRYMLDVSQNWKVTPTHLFVLGGGLVREKEETRVAFFSRFAAECQGEGLGWGVGLRAEKEQKSSSRLYGTLLSDVRWCDHSRGREAYVEAGYALKQPSWFQLFSEYGDPELQEEKIYSAAVGWAKKWSDWGFHFQQELNLARHTNLVDFDIPSSKYVNRNRVENVQLENQLTWSTQGFFKRVQGFVTLFSSQDQQTQKKVLRRSDWRAGSVLEMRMLKNQVASVQYSYVGKRDDITHTGERLTLDSYQTVNLGWTWEKFWAGNIGVMVENIANAKAQPLYGYSGTPRRLWVSANAAF